MVSTFAVANSPEKPSADRSYPLVTSLSYDHSYTVTELLGAELTEEIRQVIEQYKQWGIERDSTRLGTIKLSTSDAVPEPIEWSNYSSKDMMRERFLRSGDRFRSDCYEPSYQRRSFAFDGTIARVRNANLVHNGPLRQLASTFEDDFAPRTPHTLLVDYFLAPGIHWIFNHPRMLESIRSGNLFGELRVEQKTFSGHPCWKLSWLAARDTDGGLMSHCVVWLARDRALLPLRQEFRTPINAISSEQVVVKMKQFLREEETQRWFPKEVLCSLEVGNTLYLGRTQFRPTDRYRKSQPFTQVAALADNHRKPPKASVPAYAPAPVLTTLPGPGSIAPAATQKSRLRFAGIGMLWLAGCWVMTSVTFSQTRLGRLARDFLRHHRTLVGCCGILLVIAVGALTRTPPGWSRFGLSWMFAGAVGLGWILLTLWLLGERKLSIRMALCAAASAALLFAGYNAGMKRMRVRQKMISDIRGHGGQVVMGLWRLDEPGLFLPDSMGRLLGEAWTGRANRAAIERHQFTAKNVDRWCLDEVQWLGIASSQQEPFQLSSDALARIQDTRALWTLQVEGGYLDGACFDELARFPSLIDVYFDCQHQPIDERIRLIPELERLWLTHPVVNADLFAKLSGIETLEAVTLINPKFEQCRHPGETFGLEWVEIQYATVDAENLVELGKLPCNLVFENCRFRLTGQDRVRLLETPKVTVRQSAMDNQALNSLVESPTLNAVQLANTEVSLAGIETFSQQRPEVAVTME